MAVVIEVTVSVSVLPTTVVIVVADLEASTLVNEDCSRMQYDVTLMLLPLPESW